MRVLHLPDLVLETASRRHPHWIVRLLMGGLLAIASLSFTGQTLTSDAFAAEDGHSRFLLTSNAGSAPVILGKTSRTIQLARKQAAKDSGPDETPRMPVLAGFPLEDQASGLAGQNRDSGYDPEHILFRSGARSISTRAPPSHFSV